MAFLHLVCSAYYLLNHVLECFLAAFFLHVLSCSAAFCTTVLRFCVWSIFNGGSFCPAVSCWDRYSEVLLFALWTLNVQIFVGSVFLFCILFICLIFLFSLLTLPVCWSLCGLQAHGLVTVSASLPFGRFCPYLRWGFTPSHLSVSLPLCSIIIIVTWLLTDNLGFCSVVTSN